MNWSCTTEVGYGYVKHLLLSVNTKSQLAWMTWQEFSVFAWVATTLVQKTECLNQNCVPKQNLWVHIHIGFEIKVDIFGTYNTFPIFVVLSVTLNLLPTPEAKTNLVNFWFEEFFVPHETWKKQIFTFFNSPTLFSEGYRRYLALCLTSSVSQSVS